MKSTLHHAPALLAAGALLLPVAARAETGAAEAGEAFAPLDYSGAQPYPTAELQPAADVPEARDAGAPVEAAQSAEETLLQPFTVSARTHAGRALAKAVAGYDQSVDSFVSRSLAEARLLDFLTLRLEYEHGPGMGPDNRFGVGARAQLLNADEHGVDAGLGLFYQPNDFRDEGQVVGALLIGRFFGPVGLYANGMLGGDPEGDDVAAEGRLAAMLRLSRAFRVGLDNRFRYNMSSDDKRAGTLARNWEFQSLMSLGCTIGPLVLLGEAGLSSVSITGPFGAADEETATDTGLLAMGGAGGAF